MCELLHVRLTKRGYDAPWQTSAPKALDLLQKEHFDIVVADVQMSEMDGLEFCERVVSNQPDIHVILMTAHASVERAVAALRARARDFLVKPFEIDALVAIIESAQLRCRAQASCAVSSASFSDPGQHPEWASIVGASEPMVLLRTLVARVAAVDTSIVITGESGTGKELIARAVHQSSQRSKGPFVAFNCAAVPETLLEAELFGHTKGAFTDARSDRPGLFLEANGGVLFLDEIGELSLSMQPKLLRALQERCVRQVGGSREISFDTRIVAATNRNLETMVRQGQFREDLYYRLNVIEVPVPPLRARGDDILLCAQHFVERFAKAFGCNVRGLSREASERLLAHSWPGNVRELQNVVERAVALTSSQQITVADLPASLRRYRKNNVSYGGIDEAALFSLEEVERRHIQAVMLATGGNRTAAASILGVDRRTLLRKETPRGLAAVEFPREKNVKDRGPS
jgi:two-component system, NtrC family, response regulator AtoC